MNQDEPGWTRQITLEINAFFVFSYERHARWSDEIAIIEIVVIVARKKQQQQQKRNAKDKER